MANLVSPTYIAILMHDELMMPRTCIWWEIFQSRSPFPQVKKHLELKKGTFRGPMAYVTNDDPEHEKHISPLFFPADSLEFCNWLIWCVSTWWIILGETLFTLKCIAGNYFKRACSSDEIYLQVRPVHMDWPVSKRRIYISSLATE